MIIATERYEDGYILGTIRYPGDDIFKATLEIYRDLFHMCRQHNMSLVKIHNHIPRILQYENGEQRYHTFNLARRTAFAEANYYGKPAACGLGSLNGDTDMVVHFIMSKHPVVEISNPNQIEAYEYPDQYGPAPLFSRAVLCDGALYVSGTASIVGHETVHKGQYKRQIQQTIQNVSEILKRANFSWQDMDEVWYSTQGDMHHQCDICRDDLMVEMEATSKNGKRIEEIYTKRVDGGKT